MKGLRKHGAGPTLCIRNTERSFTALRKLVLHVTYLCPHATAQDSAVVTGEAGGRGPYRFASKTHKSLRAPAKQAGFAPTFVRSTYIPQLDADGLTAVRWLDKQMVKRQR